MSTDVAMTTPGDIAKRIAGFGIRVDRTTDGDPDGLSAHLEGIVDEVRGGTPCVQIIDTRRLGPHSKGDDTRAPEVMDEPRRADPLSRILETNAMVRDAYQAARDRIDRIADNVRKRPFLEMDTDCAIPLGGTNRSSESLRTDGDCSQQQERVVDVLNRALRELLASDSSVLILGEDIADPYGGAFKVTRGLSTDFPHRVFSTPIAEAAIVGISNGLALAGMRPVCEIMFADFATLACDQLINHAAKFYYAYGGDVTCPITVRLVSEGGRGYGPTHSQSLELLFCGIPGLRVLSLSQRHHPQRLMRDAIVDDAPTIFVEHKSLYGIRSSNTPPLDLRSVAVESSGGAFPLSYGGSGDRYRIRRADRAGVRPAPTSPGQIRPPAAPTGGGQGGHPGGAEADR